MKMNCNEANNMSIVSFLQSQGIEPVKIRQRDVWYLSPLRVESTPSFKVDMVINRWFDHGIGQGGKLIDLGIRLLNLSVKEFLSQLESNGCIPSTSQLNKAEERKLSINAVRSIQHSSLIQYLIFRNIPLPIANAFCVEVHYSIDSKKFFAIGFNNDRSGYEIRNKYFKGCLGSKGITSIIKGENEFSLFEGFFDMLSAIQLGLVSSRQSIVVLNSVNQIQHAIQLLNRYTPKRIQTFFDNDLAGRDCLDSLRAFYPFVDDASEAYSGFKDLNEMISKKYIL